jgi:hypothetical protein
MKTIVTALLLATVATQAFAFEQMQPQPQQTDKYLNGPFMVAVDAEAVGQALDNKSIVMSNKPLVLGPQEFTAMAQAAPLPRSRPKKN